MPSNSNLHHASDNGHELAVHPDFSLQLLKCIIHEYYRLISCRNSIERIVKKKHQEDFLMSITSFNAAHPWFQLEEPRTTKTATLVGLRSLQNPQFTKPLVSEARMAGFRSFI